MKKVIILLILVIAIIILAIGGLVWQGEKVKQERVTTVLSYKTEYTKGENPKVKITNNSNEKVCFSSCYPYYLEKDNSGSFVSYQYGDCGSGDIATTCLEAGGVKAFELQLDKMPIEEGPHRIAIPACVGCALQQEFRKDKWLYSNEFIIN